MKDAGAVEGERYQDVDLTLIAPKLRQQALAALEHGDVADFLYKAEKGNTEWLTIVLHNLWAFQARGVYEEALLHAWSGTRTTHARWDPWMLRFMFEVADRDRLRALGDPLPSGPRLTLYRGVAGTGALRRRRGISWTSDPDIACWFAQRYGLARSEVLRVQVKAQDVLVYLDGVEYSRKEREFLVLLPRDARLNVHTRDLEEIKAGAARHSARSTT